MTNVAEQFTEEQIQEMKEAFNMFDRNRFLAAKTQLYSSYVSMSVCVTPKLNFTSHPYDIACSSHNLP